MKRRSRGTAFGLIDQGASQHFAGHIKVMRVEGGLDSRWPYVEGDCGTLMG